MGKLAFLLGFKGRINRYQLLLGQLFSGLPMVAISLLSEIIADPLRKYLLAVTFIVALTISLFIFTKRLHDTNSSGLYLLMCLLPFINFYLIYLLISPGTPGPNKYGPQPVAPAP